MQQSSDYLGNTVLNVTKLVYFLIITQTLLYYHRVLFKPVIFSHLAAFIYSYIRVFVIQYFAKGKVAAYNFELNMDELVSCVRENSRRLHTN